MKFLFKLFFFLLALVLAAVLVASALVGAGMSDSSQKADVCIVFGSTVDNEGNPSPQLKVRLDRAVELYKEALVKTFIVSGATDNSGNNQASVMKNYLMSNGVPSLSIIVDEQSVTTYDTAKKAKQVMENKGFESVILVTQHYHMTRARYTMQSFGVSPIYTAHASLFEKEDVPLLFNEVIELGKSATLDYTE